MRPSVLLYEPRHRSARLPLSLLHVASALDARVAIVDGRLEMAPAALVAELAREALCLGVTTPTGPPLADALEVTRAARAARPKLPVIWGGPHATFRPAECLATGLVDACVLGPGERTLAEIVAALRAGGTDTGIPGVAWLRGLDLAESVPRPGEDVNGLPPVDYGLLDLEHYFRWRGARRAEVSTSRGRTLGEDWSGLRADHVVAVVGELVRRHKVEDVVFTDQGFFVDPARVLAIASGLPEAGVHVGWAASASLADLLSARERLDGKLLREGGCRRIRVFTEGAGQEGMEEQVAALSESGLAVEVTFIVGRPAEPATTASGGLQGGPGSAERGVVRDRRPATLRAVAGLRRRAGRVCGAEARGTHPPGGVVDLRSRERLFGLDLVRGAPFRAAVELLPGSRLRTPRASPRATARPSPGPRARAPGLLWPGFRAPRGARRPSPQGGAHLAGAIARGRLEGRGAPGPPGGPPALRGRRGAAGPRHRGRTGRGGRTRGLPRRGPARSGPRRAPPPARARQRPRRARGVDAARDRPTSLRQLLRVAP